MMGPIVKQYQKTLLVWLVFGLFVVTVWSLFGKTNPAKAEKPFSELIAAIDNGEIKTVTIVGPFHRSGERWNIREFKKSQ
jgi:hypothetical protein